MEGRLGFIGAGAMAEALAGGIINSGLYSPGQIWTGDVNPDRLNCLQEKLGLQVTTDNLEVVRQADILVLAVKPQVITAVLDQIGEAVSRNQLVISIVAGISIAFLEEKLGQGVPVIRTMPNTPALIGQGATVLAPGTHATEADLEVAGGLFSAVGKVWRVNEGQINAVTGLSGCGPAYIYLIIEALADAGVRVGLPRSLALELTLTTVLGSAKMVQETGSHPASLRDMVASPAGSTIEGLAQLEKGRVRSAFMEAVKASKERAEELSLRGGK